MDDVTYQRLASACILGATDTTLATSDAENCTISRSATGVYDLVIASGVPGPTGISPSTTGRVTVTSRTKNVTVVPSYGADDTPAANGTIHFNGWNESSSAAADCDFEVTVERVVKET